MPDCSAGRICSPDAASRRRPRADPVLAGANTPSTASGVAPGDSNLLPTEGSVGEPGREATDETPRQASGSDGDQQANTKCAASDFAVDLNVQPDRPGVRWL